MEFSAVNRRRPSRETPLGSGAKKDGCFSQASNSLALNSPNEGNIGLGGFGQGLGYSNRVVIVSGTSFTE